jgi:hypothetical protein
MARASVRIFFRPGCHVIPWGRASAPAGVAPKPWRSAGSRARFFDAELPAREASVSAGIGNISAGLDDLTRTGRHRPLRGLLAVCRGKCDWAHPGGVAVR